MSDNLTKKVLLVGAGPMAKDYAKVLLKLNIPFDVIGRGKESAKKFEDEFHIKVHTGGVENYFSNNKSIYQFGIVSVGVEKLAETTIALIKNNIKNILVEKPGGVKLTEVKEVVKFSEQANANVFIAYNRRFYASVLKALEIIEVDGGVSSFNFEFTEWSSRIGPLEKGAGVKEHWVLANSSHVIDLAFFLGGKPKEISCYHSGELKWHKPSVFAGAGVTDRNCLFSYQANWEGPGRWGVEIITKKHRLYFRPMESLQIQKLDSIVTENVPLDEQLDKEFKPGLFKQVEAFLNGNYMRFCRVEEQMENLKIYNMIGQYQE